MGARWAGMATVSFVLVLVAGCLGSDGPDVGEDLGPPEPTRVPGRNLTVALPGYAGDLSFGFLLQFSETRTCDVKFGWSSVFSGDNLVLGYFSASGESFSASGITAYGDGMRVHWGPADTRPVLTQARYLVSPLNPSGFIARYVDFDLSGEIAIRMVGNDVEPHPNLEGSGLMVQLECDGDFSWSDLEAGTSVVSALPEDFQGDGLNAGYAAHDGSTTKKFEMDPGTVHGLIYNDGATVESGFLRIGHPEGEEELSFPGNWSHTFLGTGGTYDLTLQRTAIKPGSMFAILFDSTRPVENLADLFDEESGAKRI